MYEIIPGKLASHGIGDTKYPLPPNEAQHEDILTYEQHFEFDYTTDKLPEEWRILDARIIDDEGNTDEYFYRYLIYYGVRMIKDKGWRVCVCCGAGQSRSNAIALGILVQHFNMDFYDAYELIREKVPIQWIMPDHISKLKKIFGVSLP